ncbi:MAG: extracellular solute-binding protein [Anaerolineae bacterium]|nr:extracellular solute-binding protein [Anaerolineae bacterium]
MRTKLILLLGLLALVFPNLGAAAPGQQGLQTLRVMWGQSPSNIPLFFEVVAGFEEDYEAANPNVDVQIELVDLPALRDTVLERVEAGNPPDLTVMQRNRIPEFVSLGLVEPIDRFLTRDFRRRFVPSIINEGAVYQGRTFGLPVATSTRALYYNLALFEQAGLAGPPESWEDLRAASTAISGLDRDEEVYGLGWQGGGGQETDTYFYYFLWGNGGDIYDASQTHAALNAPEAVQALEFVQQLIGQGGTQPEPYAERYDRRITVEELFQNGQVGMVISGPWLVARLRQQAPDLRFGVAPLPYNTTPATYGVIDTLIMLSTAENKALAWGFMEFIYADETRLAYAQAAGVLPEMTAVAQSPAFQEDPLLRVFLDLLPNARFLPLSTQTEAISERVIVALRAVYQGLVEPQAALDAAVGAINALLENEVAGW